MNAPVAWHQSAPVLRLSADAENLTNYNNMLYTEHIKDNKLFLRLYRKGKYTATEYFTAYYMPNKLPFNRFGITAGKKIGSAVVRNRAKRILREAYRKNELSMPIGYDIVFVARPGIVGAKTGDIERVLVSKILKSMKSQ